MASLGEKSALRQVQRHTEILFKSGTIIEPLGHKTDNLNLPKDSEIMNFEQGDRTLSPVQYFSIYKMPSGRTPLGSP